MGGAAFGNSHGGTVSTGQPALIGASADVAQLTDAGHTRFVTQITISVGLPDEVASSAS